MKVDAAAAAVQARHDKAIRFRESRSRSCTTCGLLSSIKAVENSSDEIIAQATEEEEEENLNASQIKQNLFAALQGAEKNNLLFYCIINICNLFVLTSLKKECVLQA